MALRNLRPSSFSESATTSASASVPSQPTSESTGSDPRSSALSNERDSRSSSQQQLSGGSISKRRRVPENITRNACVNCKKARAKCDGKKPCSRCETRSEHAACVYEVHIKHAKEELMKQIQDLRAKDQQTDRIYKALASDAHAQDVLRALRNGESHDSIVEWLEREAPSDQMDIDPYSPPASYQETYPGSPDHEINHLPPLPWTSVTRDPSVLQHLLQLYFTWVHPVSTLLSERHFIESYNKQIETFCSPLLVNAICALACCLHNKQHHDDLDFDQLGASFAQAFRKDFDPADKRITTIQATAIMFKVELANGSPRAASYLKLATDSITGVSALAGSNYSSIVLKTTIQGIRCLNVEWAQAIFECPLSLNARSVENCNLVDEEDLDSRPWFFYRFENDQTPGWPSLLKSVNRAKLELINIISDVCAMMYGPSGTKITAQHILREYARFMAWFAALPPSIVDLEKTSQALPHVLSLLILYNHSITQLLRPLIDLKDFPSMLVEEVIFTHAQRGLHLLERYYRSHFTCRYQPCFQMFTIANLCDLVARYYTTKSSPENKDGGEALVFGLDVLSESYADGTGFPVAGVLRELLRTAPSSYASPPRMPLGKEGYLAPLPKGYKQPVYTYEEFMDACGRAIYFQPLWGVREKFEPNLAQNWLELGPGFGFRRPQPGDRSLRVLEHEPDRSTSYAMQIKNLLNNSSE